MKNLFILLHCITLAGLVAAKDIPKDGRSLQDGYLKSLLETRESNDDNSPGLLPRAAKGGVKAKGGGGEGGQAAPALPKSKAPSPSNSNASSKSGLGKGPGKRPNGGNGNGGGNSQIQGPSKRSKMGPSQDLIRRPPASMLPPSDAHHAVRRPQGAPLAARLSSSLRRGPTLPTPREDGYRSRAAARLQSTGSNRAGRMAEGIMNPNLAKDPVGKYMSMKAASQLRAMGGIESLRGAPGQLVQGLKGKVGAGAGRVANRLTGGGGEGGEGSAGGRMGPSMGAGGGGAGQGLQRQESSGSNMSEQSEM